MAMPHHLARVVHYVIARRAREGCVAPLISGLARSVRAVRPETLRCEALEAVGRCRRLLHCRLRWPLRIL
eukprot:3905000-Prymnesium_polylepis.1